MNFHTFGDKGNKVVFLIHGMLTPWQIFEEAAEYFSRDYYVVVPELDAHTEDEPTGFISVEDEAEKIREYVTENFGGKVYALCGSSMGGRISAELAAMPDVRTECLVLDGAPLVPFPRLLVAFLTKNYIDLVRKSKKRDPKTMEDCRKHFLPERYVDYYLKIADNFDEGSIRPIMDSVFSRYEFCRFDPGMRILFMHGTTGNEMFSRKAAVRMKEINPQTEIRCFRGYAHAELACFEIEKWTAEVARFIR